MSEFNYLRERDRMMNSYGRTGGLCAGVKCEECPFKQKRGEEKSSCYGWTINHPDETIEVVRKWSEEHPVMTNCDKFKEVFGKTTFARADNDICDVCTCYIPCTNCDWWNEEYREPESQAQSATD